MTAVEYSVIKRTEDAEKLLRTINLHNQKWDINGLYDQGYEKIPSEYIGDVMKLYINGADAEYIEWDIEGPTESDWNETKSPSWNWQHCLYRAIMPMEGFYHVER